MWTVSASDVIQGLVVLVMSVLAWIGKTQVSRITRLEENKADKTHVKESFDELREDMKEHRKESREGFTRVFERLDTIADRIK